FTAGVLAPLGGDWAILGALEDGTLVGCVEVRRNVRRKLRHIVTFGTMYVAPEARGHGIGRALLEAALVLVGGMDGV
ncbi:GNAT family N-acetyltransferase, partial [Klebsiella pneumoniae]|nr:GNAT family N-acetyltransferase [Klebsiella pneumoniae]